MPVVLIALACALSLTTVTPVQSSDGPPSTNSNPTVSTPAAAEVFADAVLYRASRDLDLIPIATVTEHADVPNEHATHLELDKGDYVVVEETKIDDTGVKRLRISFDPIDENEPTTYWVWARDLGPADVTSPIPRIAHFKGLQSPIASAPEDDFVETREARHGRWGHARRGRRGNFCISHPTHPGCCKSAVNYKLLAMGLIRTRVGGVRARSMATGLAQQGWREVHCGARARPSRGMTCTFVGRGADHTETFDRGCWYYGAKCTAQPMHQSNRQCISCKVPGRG